MNMPFKSEKQRRYMWAKEPEIAEAWEHEKHTSGIKFTKHHSSLSDKMVLKRRNRLR